MKYIHKNLDGTIVEANNLQDFINYLNSFDMGDFEAIKNGNTN